MNTTPLTIIGGGPAGVAAACEAVKAGVKCVIVEETDRVGGKVLHHAGRGATDGEAYRAARQMRTELDRFKASITMLFNTRVWSVDTDRTVSLGRARLLKTGEDGAPPVSHLFADRVIIAGGALERVMPFPGWTLPGVMTLGAANTLVNHGVRPGKRMLVAGSGPLLLLLAANLLKAGVEVAGVVQLSTVADAFQHARSLVRGAFPDKLLIALKAAVRMLRASVPLINGSMIVDAAGEERLHTVRIAAMNNQTGKLDLNCRRRFQVDALACSYGLIPNTDISRAAGCWHLYDDQRGYWRARVTAGNESSVPGIFVAGDCLKVRGYAAATLDGRLAAVEALAQLGAIPPAEAKNRRQGIIRALRPYNAFGKALDIISRPHPAILNTLPDETIVCRCEEVTLADIRAAHAYGAVDINDIKRRTRSGMGHCQGRFCGQVISEIFAQLEERAGYRDNFTPRIPVRPVTFEDMAQ